MVVCSQGADCAHVPLFSRYLDALKWPKQEMHCQATKKSSVQINSAYKHAPISASRQQGPSPGAESSANLPAWRLGTASHHITRTCDLPCKRSHSWVIQECHSRVSFLSVSGHWIPGAETRRSRWSVTQAQLLGLPLCKRPGCWSCDQMLMTLLSQNSYQCMHPGSMDACAYVF